MGRELSGEGQVVQPGDAEHGLVNAVALEAAVPQDLPGAPRQTRSVPVPADRASRHRRSGLTTPLEEDGLTLAMRADARGAAADSDQHTLRAGIRSMGLDDFVSCRIPGTEVHLGKSRKLFAACERLREEDLAIARRTPGLRAEDQPPADLELSDEAQEEQLLTQRRIFREQQEEDRPRLRALIRDAYERGRRGTAATFFAVPRSRNSTWRATRVSSKRRRRKPTVPSAATTWPPHPPGFSSRDDSGDERTIPSQRKDRRSSACRLVGRAQRSPPAHGPEFRTVGQGHHYGPRMSEPVPARQRTLYQRGPLRRALLDTSMLTTDIIADGAVSRSTRVRGGRRSALVRRSALLPHRRGAAPSFDVRPPRTEGAQPPCDSASTTCRAATTMERLRGNTGRRPVVGCHRVTVRPAGVGEAAPGVIE